MRERAVSPEERSPAGREGTAKPYTVRLPVWAADYLQSRSARLGTSTKEVLVEAIACLRAEEVRALMAEGYAEMNESQPELAEEAMAAGAECLPE
jgi:hypothetical protein